MQAGVIESTHHGPARAIRYYPAYFCAPYRFAINRMHSTDFTRTVRKRFPPIAHIYEPLGEFGGWWSSLRIRR